MSFLDPPKFPEVDESASTILRECRLADAPPGQMLELDQAKAAALALTTERLTSALPQRYQIVRTIASGATSVVVLARDLELDRRVAVKILKRERGGARSLFGRFLREWEVIHSLEHPHIVQGLDYQKGDHLCYIVMEYMAGGSLQQLITREGPLAPGRAVKFILQASSALAESHGAGVIHRDVKPANLLIDAADSVKLTDFGVARFDTLQPSLTLQFGENVLGTVNYMAPEQAFDSHMVDCRVDIYALGCTMYYLLTGQPPFNEGSAHQRMLKHRNETPKGIELFRDDVPVSLIEICNRMMAKLPGNRFESADVLVQELAAWMGENRALLEPSDEAEAEPYEAALGDPIELTVSPPAGGSNLASGVAGRTAAAGNTEDIPTSISPNGLWHKVLIVGECLVEQRLAGGLLQRDHRLQLAFARSGAEALGKLRESMPALVLTDLAMPELNGLQLLGEIRGAYPQLPVVLMTAQGDEATALDALRQGAASFVPKAQFADRLLSTVTQVLSRVEAERGQPSVQASLQRLECEYALDSNPAQIAPLVNLLQQSLAGMGYGDAVDRIRLGIATEEALFNALYHGNLELDAQQFAQARGDRNRLLAWLSQRPPNEELARRRVSVQLYVSAKLAGTQQVAGRQDDTARIVIRDQGRGFKRPALGDNGLAASFDEGCNRGLTLMRALVDELIFNDDGTQVTLVKHRQPANRNASSTINRN